MKNVILSCLLMLLTLHRATAAEVLIGNKTLATSLYDSNYFLVMVGDTTTGVMMKVPKSNVFQFIVPLSPKLTNLALHSGASGYAFSITNTATSNNMPFNLLMQVSDSNPSLGPNQVSRLGWNIDASGNLLQATNGALFDTWEGNYEPTTGEVWVERHFTSKTTNSTIAEQRWLTYFNVVKASSRPRQGYSIVGTQSDEFWIQDRALNQVLKIYPGTQYTGVTNGYLFNYPFSVSHQYNNHTFPFMQKDTGGTYRYGAFLSNAGVWVHGLQQITNEFQSKIRFNGDNTYDIGGETNNYRPRNIYAGTAVQSPQVKLTGGQTSQRIAYIDSATNVVSLPFTLDTSAATSFTINNASGRVLVSAAASSFTVNNSLVTANSAIVATVNSNDATAKTVLAVPTAGVITVTFNAATTANTDVSFLVINP